jgi:hypothetical protein
VAKARKEAERVGKDIIRPLLSLERLPLNEQRAQVCYRYEKAARETEWMGYLEFIARITSYIPVNILIFFYSVSPYLGRKNHKEIPSANKIFKKTLDSCVFA